MQIKVGGPQKINLKMEPKICSGTTKKISDLQKYSKFGPPKKYIWWDLKTCWTTENKFRGPQEYANQSWGPQKNSFKDGTQN